MIYVAIEQYDKNVIRQCALNNLIEGVVLGDGYCQKRMFEYGEAELLECIQYAHDLNLKVLFQTPVYMTERIFEQTLDKIAFLYERKICEGIIVQDVGFAFSVHERMPDLSIIWGQLSAVRNGAENMLHYEFLKKIGISTIEAVKPELVEPLEEIGFKVVCSNEEIQYSTVNRECYYIHELGVWNKHCERGCIRKKVRMVNEYRNLDMTVDGFMLGKNYKKTEGNSSNQKSDDRDIIFRGVNLKEIVNTIEQTQGGCGFHA